MAQPRKKQRKATPKERARVLAAFDRGDDWVTVAIANEISERSAYRLVKTRQLEDKKRGGVRQKLVKMTPEIMIFLEECLEYNPTMTLEQMHCRIVAKFGVVLSVSTISRHLLGLTYTMKQVRMEKDAMNSGANKRERREFAVKLEEYRRQGHMIVYCDETNYNCYVTRQVGRAKKGERAVYTGPISQGKNLQIQCAVANGIGLVEVNYVLNKIDMDMNASFLLDAFISALRWADFRADFCGKKIVLVLDNAPAHERTEDMLEERVLEIQPPLPAERLVTLRLAPYSPMCNPIEGCFSVLKSEVKNYVAENIERLRFQRVGETHEARKQRLLLDAAQHSMSCITPTLVLNEEIHSAYWWTKAMNMEDMHFGA